MKNGCHLEATCVSITKREWDRYMKGSTRADRRLAVKIAYEAGLIPDDEYKRMLSNPWYNPYNHYKTKTHLIYVHSSTEHFIRIY